MPGEAIRFGPFTGGLNLAADPSSVGDDDLIDCVNLELDIDGSLVNRPPISIEEVGTTDERLLIFGTVSLSGNAYLFATQDGSTFVSSDNGASWTELDPDSDSRECMSLAVYDNSVWLPATPDSANGGISWDPSGGAVAQDDMPRGIACTVHKNRLYICPGYDETSNASRLHFSSPADFTDWPGSNFVDIQPGDGDTLNNIITYQDNLLLFKGESTHVLAYDLDPADAVLGEANAVIGTHSAFGVVQHENTAYCIHHGNVYEIVNFNFGLLNIKVPFEYDDSLPTGTSSRHESHHLSLLGDRLVARYFNKTYVFGLRTRTWSEWKKTDTSSSIEWHIFGPLIRGVHTESSVFDEYYTSYSFTMNDESGYKIFKISDGFSADDSEGDGHEMECIATTKDYDMADPIRFKRLFWWGADLISGNDIEADVRPITLLFSPSWEQLGELTWSELNTWDSPIDTPLSTSTEVEGDGNFSTSKMVKFKKSLRFRKVNFSVKLKTDGTISNVSKIFAYYAIVRTKQVVSSQEN